MTTRRIYLGDAVAGLRLSGPALGPPPPPPSPVSPLVQLALDKLGEQPSDGMSRLPNELRLAIVELLDDRDPSAALFEPPPLDLVRLAATCRWFSMACRPHLWRNPVYVAAPADESRDWRRQHDLRRLKVILSSTLPPVVKGLAVHGLWRRKSPFVKGSRHRVVVGEQQEGRALASVVECLAKNGLEALALEDFKLHKDVAEFLLRYLSRAPKLSFLRISAVDLYLYERRKEPFRYFGPLPQLKSLQLTQCDPVFLDLIDQCKNLRSLVLSPSPSTFGRVADEEVLEARHSENGVVLPLQELIVEGRWEPQDLDLLISALAYLPDLRLLALTRTGAISSHSVGSIVRSSPKLEALSLIAGSGSAAVRWPSQQDDYLAELGALDSLHFFVSDRLPPIFSPPYPTRSALREDKGVRRMVEGCKAMMNACSALSEVMFVTGIEDEQWVGTCATFSESDGYVSMTTERRKMSYDSLAYARWSTKR